MMIDAPVSFKMLQNFLDYERPSDVIRWLDINRVPYKLAKKKPITTMSAINKAIIGEEDEAIEFDIQ